MTSRIHTLLVVALPAEARPLLKRWKLVRDTSSRAFPVYHSTFDTEAVSLVVSGIGQVNAAAACAHLYQLCATQNAIWINTGIAGHANRAIGDVLLAHSVADARGGEKHFPPILFDVQCNTDQLLTLDAPSDQYPEHAAIDMEASAFFSVATKYTTAELVQAVKVISDNNAYPIEDITPQSAAALMENAISTLETVMVQLRTLADIAYRQDDELPVALTRFRFTTTQRNQCKDLLRRWQALTGSRQLPDEEFTSLASAKQALSRLKTLVDSQTITYSA